MISKKILEQINNYPGVSDEFKSLALAILEKEDKGLYAYKEEYDKLVNEYLKKEETSNDSN